MIAKSHLLAAVLAGILASSMAGAQTHSGTAPIRTAGAQFRSPLRVSATARRAPSSATLSARRANFAQIPPSGLITNGFPPIPSSFGFLGNFDVPGLGFDYPHLAAISSALQNSSFGFGHFRGHFGQGSFVPIFFGGYPYYYGDLDYEEPAVQEQPQSQPAPQTQPQIVQQTVPAQSGAGTFNESESYSALSAAPEATEPVRDVGEFVLVRRDGRVLFASMFMVSGTKLTYVTPEGLRHTLALADLDVDATQQMNEARGTTIQIHN
jgi:hypothetical protein